jgi:hypothetical protein
MVTKKNRIYLITCLYICELYGADNALLATLNIRRINHIEAAKEAIELAKLRKVITNDFNPMLSYRLIRPCRFGAPLFRLKILDSTYVSNKESTINQ